MTYKVAQARTEIPAQPVIIEPPYYKFLDLGIIGFVTITVAIAGAKILPDWWQARKEEEKAKRDFEREEAKDRREFEQARAASSAKLVSDSFNTMMAKQMQSSQELLETLATTQFNIAQSVEAQQQQATQTAEGFKQSILNQTEQITVLRSIQELIAENNQKILALDRKILTYLKKSFDDQTTSGDGETEEHY